MPSTISVPSTPGDIAGPTDDPAAGAGDLATRSGDPATGAADRARGAGGAAPAHGAPPSRGLPDLLGRLRGDVAVRPKVDWGLAGGLREWLEDGVAASCEALDPGVVPLGVDKEALSAVLGPHPSSYSPRRLGTRSPRPVTMPLARGILVDLLFRQLVTTGRIDDPVADGLAALEVEDGRDAVVEFVRSLRREGRAALDDEVISHAERLTVHWPALPPFWLPRTQERSTIALGGGKVVLTGAIDLTLGAPSSGCASVVLVEVKSGARRPEHRAELHFYALLETLRSGAPPLRVATWYSATGAMDVDEVTDELLAVAVRRTLAGVERLCALAGGGSAAGGPRRQGEDR